MGMRASCSFLSSRDAFKCQEGCASCELLHYFCCYPCTGSSCVQKSCLQQVSIQTLPVLGRAEPHSCHHPQETEGHPGTSPQHSPGSLGWAPFISALGNRSRWRLKPCRLTLSSSARKPHQQGSPSSSSSFSWGSGAASLPAIALSGH